MNRKLVDNHCMYKCAKFEMDRIQNGRLAAILFAEFRPKSDIS